MAAFGSLALLIALALAAYNLLAGALALVFAIPLALVLWLIVWVGQALAPANGVGY